MIYKEPSVRNPYSERRNLNVGLMGASLGTGNRGVSALAVSVIKLITDQSPTAQISLLIGNKTDTSFVLDTDSATRTIPIVNYRMSLKSGLKKHILWIFFLALLYRLIPLAGFRAALGKANPWLGYVSNADLILDIRGGDSFSDIYGIRNFITGSLGVLAVLLVRGRIGLLPQTYGPFNSHTARMLAAWILRRAAPILSRDSESVLTIERLIGKTDRCRFCPDVAFSLQTRPPRKLQIEPAISGVKLEHLIGLNVNGLMFNGGYTRSNMFGLKLDYPKFLLRFVEAVLSDPQNHILLVPHTFAPPQSVESDPQACREVRARLAPELQARVHMLEGDYDQSEVKSVIGRCGFFVGSRMHACIAALSQGIPTIGVAYSKKFVGVFETVGAKESVLDGRDLAVDDAIARALDLFSRRDSIRVELLNAVANAQAIHKTVFADLIRSVLEPGTRQDSPLVLHHPKISPAERTL